MRTFIIITLLFGTITAAGTFIYRHFYNPASGGSVKLDVSFVEINRNYLKSINQSHSDIVSDLYSASRAISTDADVNTEFEKLQKSIQEVYGRIDADALKDISNHIETIELKKNEIEGVALKPGLDSKIRAGYESIIEECIKMRNHLRLRREEIVVLRKSIKDLLHNVETWKDFYQNSIGIMDKPEIRKKIGKLIQEYSEQWEKKHIKKVSSNPSTQGLKPAGNIQSLSLGDHLVLFWNRLTDFSPKSKTKYEHHPPAVNIAESTENKKRISRNKMQKATYIENLLPVDGGDSAGIKTPPFINWHVIVSENFNDENCHRQGVGDILEVTDYDKNRQCLLVKDRNECEFCVKQSRIRKVDPADSIFQIGSEVILFDRKVIRCPAKIIGFSKDRVKLSFYSDEILHHGWFRPCQLKQK